MNVTKAIIFCGMPGSGKSIGATVAKDLGIPVFVMGDIVREEVSRQQRPHTPKTLARVMVELREQFGPAVIANKCIEKFQQVSTPYAVIDGARSELEIEAFRKAIENVTVVAVHASPRVRFERLRERRRADDALTKEIFQGRDARELDIGLGRVIAQAEIMLINEGKVEDLKSKVQHILKEKFNLK